MQSWYETAEHVEALKRHVSKVTVRDMLFYFIYKFEKDKIDGLLLPKSTPWFKRYRLNKPVWKKYKKDYDKYAKHVRFIEDNVKDPMEFANVNHDKSNTGTDTTLVNWLIEQQSYFGFWSNESHEDILNMPYETLNEYRIGYEKQVANARKIEVNNRGINADNFNTIDHHVKRKSPYARKLRLLQSQEGLETFLGS